MSHVTGTTNPEEGELSEVARKARVYFQEDVANELSKVLPDGWKTLIRDKVLQTNVQLNQDKFPNSVAEFIGTLSPVFNASYLRSLEARLASFDALVGAPLGDAFIGDRSYITWIDMIVEPIASACYSDTSGAELGPVEKGHGRESKDEDMMEKDKRERKGTFCRRILCRLKHKLMGH